MAPQHYTPPNAREMRAYAVQRLQAGLFGLSAIVLIVGLANIIKDRARLNEDGLRPVAVASPEAATKANDPLADIGVVPSAMSNDAASATTAPPPRNGN
ncbi:hypothetical protein ACFFF7_03190 [Novosphingobium aquiterrae]|uniref:Energy transducer TonB n=1 Tax=Novosphingobium aquiterrae TaxID=624388 RepID=A0ABV6PF05_9SPHN